MCRHSWGAVLKVWVYAAMTLLLGAGLAPLGYNAGKALAEVSATKSTNGPLEWVAQRCAGADFVDFHRAALLVAAVLCFFPWMEWLHAGRPSEEKVPGPWLLRLPGGGCRRSGQPLRGGLRGWTRALSGFLLMAGLLLSLGVALVPAGFYSLHQPHGGLVPAALRAFVLAAFGAGCSEVFFRGLTQGIFLRAMRPSAAIGTSAAFYALVVCLLPQRGITLPDPDAGRAGFDMLAGIVARFGDLSPLVHEFGALLAMGLLLGYARWRCASLWLPIGLQSGWLFAHQLLSNLALPKEPAPQTAWIQYGLVPLVAVLTASAIIYGMTAAHDENAAACQ